MHLLQDTLPSLELKLSLSLAINLPASFSIGPYSFPRVEGERERRRRSGGRNRSS